MTGTDLRLAAEQYLGLRRAMGYELARHDHLIDQFLHYLQNRGSVRITVAAAVEWACLPAGTRPRWHAARLAVIRGFATYVHAHQPDAAEPIPASLLSARVDHAVPYLYSPEEITALVEAAYRLRPPVRGLTVATVIGLMAATGVRIGEALALDVDSLDVADSAITVCGKYNRQRRLPVDRSVTTALTGYVHTSRALVATGRSQASLFLTCRGTRPRQNNIQTAFRTLTTTCGIGPATGNDRRPRLHDLRHTMAVSTLIDAHRDDVDVDARIAALATYLGHVSPASSYWYLTASPELLDVVAGRIPTITEGALP